MINIIDSKALSSCVFFAVAFLFGLVPYWCLRRCVQERASGLQRSCCHRIVFQCLQSLASGVLIATCLIHLLPESLESVHEAIASRHNKKQLAMQLNATDTTWVSSVTSDTDEEDGEHYPIGEFLIALGFLMVYIVDSGLKACSKGERVTNNTDMDATEEDIVFIRKDRTGSQKSTATLQLNESTESHSINGHDPGRKFHFGLKWLECKLTKSPTPYEPVDQAELDNSESDVIGEDVRLHTTQTASATDINSQLRHSPSFEILPHTGVYRKSNNLRYVALVSALVIHGFFDGVMIGLQTSVPVVMSLLFAIALHKSFVSAGLSLRLSNTDAENVSAITISLLILTFALSSPLGILLSSVFLHETFETSSDGEVSLVPGCMQSVAVGTFMYVSFTEMTERPNRNTLLADFMDHLFLLTGFGFMAGLRALVGES